MAVPLLFPWGVPEMGPQEVTSSSHPPFIAHGTKGTSPNPTWANNFPSEQRRNFHELEVMTVCHQAQVFSSSLPQPRRIPAKQTHCRHQQSPPGSLDMWPHPAFTCTSLQHCLELLQPAAHPIHPSAPHIHPPADPIHPPVNLIHPPTHPIHPLLAPSILPIPRTREEP